MTRKAEHGARRAMLAVAFALSVALWTTPASASTTIGILTAEEPSSGPRMPAHGATGAEPTPPSDGDWSWPVETGRRVIEPFRAPAHDYGPGHRGMDVAAAPGVPVRAPADGVVAFRGVVVDRPLITIDHGDGLVSTLEPAASDLAPGDVVTEGQPVGVVASGGHSVSGTLHVGVRWNDRYINPLPLFGGVPRAVLLPCCS